MEVRAGAALIHGCVLPPRFVVGAVTTLLDFIQTLEGKLSTLRHSPAAADRLAQLVSHMTSL